MGNSRRTLFALLATGACAGVLALAIPGPQQADAEEVPATEAQLAHAKPHTSEQLKAFNDVFMEEVRKGDLLFHGDAATEKAMGVNSVQHRHGLRHVPSDVGRHPSARVPEVPGADRQVRDPARHDQLVHRKAEPGRADRIRTPMR